MSVKFIRKQTASEIADRKIAATEKVVEDSILNLAMGIQQTISAYGHVKTGDMKYSTEERPVTNDGQTIRGEVWIGIDPGQPPHHKFPLVYPYWVNSGNANTGGSHFVEAAAAEEATHLRPELQEALAS